MDLSLRIKYLLKGKKLEQKDLAEALGVNSKTAHNYLNGNTKIVAEQLPAIANLLGISLDDLFPGYNQNTKLSESNDVSLKYYNCPECIEKQKKIDELEKERDEFRRKYIDCLEDIREKKKASGWK